MAKITYGVPVTDDTDVAQYYTSVVYDKKDSGPSKLVYVDKNTGAEVIFKGSHLGVDSHTGIINSGNLSEVDFVDSANKPLLTLDFTAHDNITGKGLQDAFLHGYHGGPKGVAGEFAYIFKGNDNITGSKGGDYIVGWGGNDTINGKDGSDFLAGLDGKDKLIGGAGDDVFEFGHGYGKDTITDFDAHGDSDKIWALNGSATFKTVDGNTVISYNDHDTLTLVGYDHFTKADFFHPM